MSLSRTCTKTACHRSAVATLTYAYADRAVVLGPLATYAEPHSYDLCVDHATRMTAPRGWDVVRIGSDGYEPVEQHDDLVAVLEAVRESSAGARRGPVAPHPATPASPATPATPAANRQPARGASSAAVLPTEIARRAHLRVLRGSGEG